MVLNEMGSETYMQWTSEKALAGDPDLSACISKIIMVSLNAKALRFNTKTVSLVLALLSFTAITMHCTLVLCHVLLSQCINCSV